MMWKRTLRFGFLRDWVCESNWSWWKERYGKWYCDITCCLVLHVFMCIASNLFGTRLCVIWCIGPFRYFVQRFRAHVLSTVHAFFSLSKFFICTMAEMSLKKDCFVKYVVCRKCYSLYKFEDCVRNFGGDRTSAVCKFVRFPNHPQRERRRPCGEFLLKTVELSDGRKNLYPIRHTVINLLLKHSKDLHRGLSLRKIVKSGDQEDNNRASSQIYMMVEFGNLF